MPVEAAEPAGELRARPHAAAAFWVSVLCVAARRAPWLVRLLRPVTLFVAWHSSRELRERTAANVRGLLGFAPDPRTHLSICRGVVASFHDFIFELAELSHLSPEAARARVIAVEGREHYERARAMGHGVIVVTAHLGSFEIALAALAEVEPRLYVVFRRDEVAFFERARAAFRDRLGVRECPVEHGLAMWAGLRDALGRGATVLVQGDRVLPGQPGTAVRFGAGRMLVPSGPVRLARLTGSPLLPAVSLRDADGSIQVLIGEPIVPPASAEEDSKTLQRLADSLADFVTHHPEQWITLQRVFLAEPGVAPACCQDRRVQ